MSRGKHTEEEKLRIKESKKRTLQRHASMVVRCFELKFVLKRLNNRQKEDLNKIFLEGKRLYNAILAETKSRSIPLHCIKPTDYKEVICLDKNKNPIVFPLERLPSHYKQTIHARMIANQKAIIRLVKNGLQKYGKLHFKKELTCIPLKGIDWKLTSANKIYVTGIHGRILVRGTDQIPEGCEFANANLLRRPDGYYLKVTTYIDKDKIKKEKTNGKEIGLDFGIKNMITTSEGKIFDVSVGESDRLKRLQKKLSHQKKGSNQIYRTKNLLAREYQKINNRKQDITNKIVHEFKAYSRIYMQDENLNEWKKSGFGKKVQYSCLGKIKAKLRLLPHVVVLDRYIPTTKLCPKCGTVNQFITLKDRTFKCGCGYSEDRDIHAAKNMISIVKSCFENNLVPPEQREITLAEFNASTSCSNTAWQAWTSKQEDHILKERGRVHWS